jgi:CubicO group peptidase (beta-lactamase class C family)
MSVTKLVVGIGVALSFRDDTAVLDVPLADRWFPEWQEGPKATITLRHVLTHTTGLGAPPAREVYGMSDIVRAALDAPVVSPPGRFTYNNLVINLAGEVLGRETGSSLHEWMGAHVFPVLGIDDWYWRTDPAGNTHCFADLELRADDLLKLGQLLTGANDLNIAIPEAWCQQIAPDHGQALGLTSFARFAWIRDGATGPEVGPRIGFGHDGDQGQHLVLLEGGYVAVRLRAWEPRPPPGTDWLDFASDVWSVLQGQAIA